MLPFQIQSGELFAVGESDLSELLDSPCKINHALLFFCTSGTAEISILLNKFTVRQHTMTTLFPNSILTLNQASGDFRVTYISFVKSLFDEAVFRLDPPFFRLVKDNPCYTHNPPEAEIIHNIIGLVKLIYADKNNIHRDIIIKNQLQNFFLNMYDKTRHAFTSIQRNGYNRTEDIFHKFMTSIHAHCLKQKDVAFYAGELCISPRYLSAITRQVAGESAKTIIDHRIILEIKVMLRSTEMTVQEITNRLDFPNQSYLGRYFKKHTGESPVEYRDKRR